MKVFAWFSLTVLAASVAVATAAEPPAPPAAKDDAFRAVAAPFLKAHCVSCHGPDKQEGDLTLHDLKGDLAGEKALWTSVLEQVVSGAMPPKKLPRPPAHTKAAFVAWLKAGLPDGGADRLRTPRHGNLVPHDELFGKPAGPVVPPPERIWRLRPEAYNGFVQDVFRERVDKLTQPFGVTSERGFKDYADLYFVDEVTTEILLRNAEGIVAAQTAHETKDGKTSWAKGTIPEFRPLFDPDKPPTPAQLEAALRAQFKLAAARAPTADEVKKLVGLYEKNLKVADRAGAARGVLAAVLMRPDSVFRSERGMGPEVGPGRRILAPQEIAAAVSLALGNHRDAGLFAAADKGELKSGEQVAAHVRRILDDPKADSGRLLKFFREYFEYDLATEVFKDKPKDVMHVPNVLVDDTDRLVRHILNEDKDVFRQLLTTNKTFANYAVRKNDKTKEMEAVRASVPQQFNDKGRKSLEAVYGLDEWAAAQPVELPKDRRAGILTQPSWLVAHSTNFDNDTVRRARWVRERLLGGSVPELPIGVAAQVPADPHRTYRERLTVTRAAACWKCHVQMDELGLPFEQFDHYGRDRTAEPVLDLEATAKNVDKKGKPLGPVMRDAPLNTAGAIVASGDPTIDGPVKGPVELVRKIAGSNRARQVFVRHAFRFFMGRNETPGDAKTLQDADAAYVKSGGSFKTLVVALLASDSFLLRSTAAPAPK